MSEIVREMLLEHTFKASLEREIQGTLGTILVFRHSPRVSPERFAVKTVDPKRVDTTYEALRRFSHEIRHWIRYRHHPFVVSPFYTAFVEQWPCVVMPYCEANLRACIARDGSAVSPSEAVALMVEVLEALSYARERGLQAHQDLKPENVLLRNVRVQFRLPDEYPFTWTVRLADFGLANGYAELNVPWGSRPYLAPEQYEKDRDLRQVDVFACGVMFHELLTGRHPIGVVTNEVWPEPAPGQSSTWRHETKWRKWANGQSKDLSTATLHGYDDLIEATLDTDPGKRPDYPALKAELVDRLERLDGNAHQNLAVLLEEYNRLAAESEASGEDDERYKQGHIAALTRAQPQ